MTERAATSWNNEDVFEGEKKKENNSNGRDWENAFNIKKMCDNSVARNLF